MADKERVVLIVTSAAEPKEYNNNKVINFAARKDGETTSAGYETWGEELVDLVKKDARLDCEITYVEKQDKTVNRVTQMFDAQGKAIKQNRRSGSGGGGRSYGKSDYQIQLERVSIEGQTAFNGIIELMKADKLPGGDTPSSVGKRVSDLALEYAEIKLRAGMKAISPPQPAQNTGPAKTTPKKAETKSDNMDPDHLFDNDISEADADNLRHLAQGKGYTKDTIMPLLKMFGAQKISELTAPQGVKFKELLEKGEGLAPKQAPLSNV